MPVVAKRTVMTLFSDANDIYSHQVRIVLAEKAVNFEFYRVNPDTPCEDLLEVNPYGTIPTLMDRGLVLYDAKIIMEYLDERFPHPPLLPVYPDARGHCRKLMFRIEQDWYSLLRKIEQSGEESARHQLRDSLIGVDAVFASKAYFLSDEFSLVDCCLAPLLWRLPQLGVEIPNHAKGIKDYAKRIFDRNAFQASLTEVERELWAA